MTQDWQKLLTFPGRSIPRYAIPVKPAELQVGEVYFRLHYLDDRMRIPELVPLVFIGRDVLSDPEQGHLIDFQDAESYLSGNRLDDPPTAVEGETEEEKYESILRRPRFESFNEADGGGVYTFENALNLLLLCWLENYAPEPPIA